MPEPVVIIKPAAGPAGPIAGPTATAEDASTRGTSRGPAGLAEHAVSRRILRRTAALLARSLWATSAATVRAIGYHPRTSLAAGASVLILGSTWFGRPQPGGGKHSPVTNEIAGNLFAPAAIDRKDTVGTKSKASAVSQGDMATADPGNTAAAGSGNPERIQADATSPPNVAAPAGRLDDVPSIPSVTDASATGKETPTTAKSATTVELASGSKAEQDAAPAPAHDPMSATLPAAPAPETALASSLPVTRPDKGGTDSTQEAPILDPPAPATTSTIQPIEPAPVPALASAPSQLATAPKSAGNKPQAAQNRIPNPAADPHRQKVATAEHKLPLDTAPNETKLIQNPVSDPKLDQALKPDPSTPKPNSTEKDQKGPETSKSVMPKLVSAPPELQARLKANEPAAKPTVPIPSHGAPVIHPDAAGSAALPVETLAPRTEASIPQGQDVAAKSDTPVPSPPTRPDSGSSTVDSKEPATRSAELEPRTPIATPHSQHVEPRTPQDMTGAGWVSIPNTGKLPVDGEESIDTRSGDADPGLGSESTVARDLRAHATKNVSFEPASALPRIRPHGADGQAQTGERSVASSGSQQVRRAGSDFSRVECVPHLVERGENFWTISRLYYNSGRYHRALWKANSDKYPEINILHIGDTIMIPPVEDLDQAYILPSRTHTPSAYAGAERSLGGHGNSNRQDDATDLAEPAVSQSSRREPTSTARTNRPSGSADGVPLPRSLRTDPELDLPVTDGTSRGERTRGRAGRPADPAVNDDDRNSDEPEIRTAARPHRSDTTSPSQPVYKVRSYDTLRSIARDTLGDSRRADEILELNRGRIDDPTQLIVGQILELPVDARTTLHGSTRRR